MRILQGKVWEGDKGECPPQKLDFTASLGGISGVFGGLEQPPPAALWDVDAKTSTLGAFWGKNAEIFQQLGFILDGR